MKILQKRAQPGCPLAAQGVWQYCPPCQTAQQPPARRGCLVQKEATNDGVVPPKMLRFRSISDVGRAKEQSAPLPQVPCQSAGQGLPSRGGSSKPLVFERAPAILSGRAVGRRGGS